MAVYGQFIVIGLGRIGISLSVHRRYEPCVNGFAVAEIAWDGDRSTRNNLLTGYAHARL
jgi:hypothetical protein